MTYHNGPPPGLPHPSIRLMPGFRAFVLVSLLPVLCAAPAGAEEEPMQEESRPQQESEAPQTGEEQKEIDKAEKEEDKKAEEVADTIEDSEAEAEVKQERQEKVEEIETGARRPWIHKWADFQKATRDITNWDFKEGMFRARLGIRFQIDITSGDSTTALQQATGPIEESIDFRRARLFLDGDIARRYHFRFEADFGIDSGLKDAYIDNVFRHLFKVVAMRFGNFREPFSLERMTSTNFGGFLERSLPVETFAPGRNIGVAGYGNHLDARLAWTFGAFTHGDSSADNPGASDLTFTGRITGLPGYRDDGEHLIHLGLSASLRQPQSDAVAYTTRPEARFTPNFLNTGSLPADKVTLAGFEFATVQGPAWVQAEAIGAQPDIDQVGPTNFGGAYVEFGWFHTGESRTYQRFDGTFGRIEPLRPLQRGGNPFKKNSPGGALEFTGRASLIDLNDGPVQAGRMFDVTLGMNWYLTRNHRCLVNYVRSDVEDIGYANIFLIRYQYNPGYHWPPLDPRWSRPDVPEDAQSRE